MTSRHSGCQQSPSSPEGQTLHHVAAHATLAVWTVQPQRSLVSSGGGLCGLSSKYKRLLKHHAIEVNAGCQTLLSFMWWTYALEETQMQTKLYPSSTTAQVLSKCNFFCMCGKRGWSRRQVILPGFKQKTDKKRAGTVYCGAFLHERLTKFLTLIPFTLYAVVVTNWTHGQYAEG